MYNLSICISTTVYLYSYIENTVNLRIYKYRTYRYINYDPYELYSYLWVLQNTDNCNYKFCIYRL